MNTEFVTASDGKEVTIYNSNLEFFKTYSFNAIRFNKKKILAFVKKETNASPKQISDLYTKLTMFVKEVSDV